MKIILPLLIILTSLFLQDSIAQDGYYITKYTSENGLSHNNIKSIVKDKTGFIWLATFDGLSRFDGYEFRNYRHIPNDSTSIPDFNADKVCIDSMNNLWAVFTSKLIAKYNRASDNFTRYIILSDSSKKIFNISDITVDQEGKFWIIGKDGIKKFNYKLNDFESVKLLDEKSQQFSLSENVGFLDFDNNGDLWIGDEETLKCSVIINKNKGFVLIQNRFSNIELAIRKDQPYIFDINHEHYVSSDGGKWIFSNWGLFRFDSINSRFEHFKESLPLNKFVGKSQFSWSELNYGLRIYFGQENKFVNINPETNQYTRTFYIDENRDIWLSLISPTEDGLGLMYYHATPSFFKHYLLNFKTRGSQISVFSILKDRFNNLWVSNKNCNYIICIKPDGTLLKENILPDNLWLKTGYPRMIVEDSSGIWFGYYQNMLSFYSYKSNHFSNILFNKSNETKNLLPTSYRLIYQDKSGNIVIGDGYGNLFLYDPAKSNLKVISDFRNEAGGFFSVTAGDSGNIWLGYSHSTIFSLDSNYQKKTSYKLCETNYNVQDICIGDNQDLWIAFLGGGICRFNPQSGEKEFFTTANGLSNNTTYKILKDKKGYLWISTNHGISRLNPQTKQFRNFGPADGLKIDEFNSNAAYQTPEGEIFFGGAGGVVSFYPDSIEVETTPLIKSSVLITGLIVSGTQRFFEKAVYDLKKVNLKKGDNNFSVTFLCIDFPNSDKIMYRYKLTGYKDEWTVTDHTHRYINYENLDPDDYKLEIEATNRDGDWINKTSLSISIPPFFYQTGWFKVFVILFSSATIAAFLLLYISRIRLNAKQIQSTLKLESLRGQMNPHFIFNSLNSINYFISQNDRLSANRYIADFARLIRSILNNMSLEFVPLEKELESLTDYLNLEHLRFGDKFEYVLFIDPQIDITANEIFPGLVQPFIENSIWHGLRGIEGRKGKLSVRFESSEKSGLFCLVEDDGIGRTLSDFRKGNNNGKQSRGIGIIMERLKTYNSLYKANFQVLIEDVHPDLNETGTRVKIEIPLKNSRIELNENEP